MSLITQVLPNLTGGGAERVAVNLGNYWASRGHDVEIVLMHPSGVFLNAVSPGVKVIDLKAERIRRAPGALQRYLLSRQPDITLAHMWPLTSAAWLAWVLARKPGKLFLCEHIGLSDHIRRDLDVKPALARAIVSLTHSRASGVIAVSLGAAADLAAFGRMPNHRVSTIHNPVADPRQAIRARESTPSDGFGGTGQRFRTRIVSVGTLKPQKNHSLLLKAFSLIAEELDASLVILGEGSERAPLEQQVEDLGLQDRVELPGFHQDPVPWLESADLFVLSSDYEGFANVIVEALACGTPVVSTDCSYGPAEILSKGKYGVLVPVGDAHHLADGMRQALLRRWNPQELKHRALDFAIPKQGDEYLKVFGL
jgi:glycosyltransferase involved in cell wall biosynthesis